MPSQDSTLRLKKVLILGGGRYGTIALERLRDKAEEIIVVDIDPHCRAKVNADGVASSEAVRYGASSFVVGDGVSYLSKLIEEGDVPDFVVLTIPKNIMAALFISWVESRGLKAEFDPPSMLRTAERLPEEYIVAKDTTFGVLVVSFAKRFTCLDGCPQPDVCPISGSRRQRSVLDLLTSVTEGDFVKIFESRLLERDVGGVQGSEIFEGYKSFSAEVKRGMRLAIGTACRCHGIVNFLRVTDPSG